MLNVRTYEDSLKEASLEVIPIKHRLQNEDKQLRFEQETYKIFNTFLVIQLKNNTTKIPSPAHNLVAHDSTADLIVPDIVSQSH